MDDTLIVISSREMLGYKFVAVFMLFYWAYIVAAVKLGLQTKTRVIGSIAFFALWLCLFIFMHVHVQNIISMAFMFVLYMTTVATEIGVIVADETRQ